MSKNDKKTETTVPVVALCTHCWRSKVLNVTPNEAVAGKLGAYYARCECSNGIYGNNSVTATPILIDPEADATRIKVLEHERDWWKKYAEDWRKADEKKDIELKAIKETLHALGRGSMGPFPFIRGPW